MRLVSGVCVGVRCGVRVGVRVGARGRARGGVRVAPLGSTEINRALHSKVMPPVTDILDLGQLGLKHGGGLRLERSVPLGEFVFGEQHYALAEDPVPVTVDISRTLSGKVIRVRLEGSLVGPCMRCFGEYSLPLSIDTSEVHDPALEEELASDYVTGQDLDLAALVRDAIGLALPSSISSPIDEDGICTDCEDSAERLAKLTDSPSDQAGEALDPRWAKLRELEL